MIAVLVFFFFGRPTWLQRDGWFSRHSISTSQQISLLLCRGCTIMEARAAVLLREEGEAAGSSSLFIFTTTVSDLAAFCWMDEDHEVRDGFGKAHEGKRQIHSRGQSGKIDLRDQIETVWLSFLAELHVCPWCLSGQITIQWPSTGGPRYMRRKRSWRWREPVGDAMDAWSPGKIKSFFPHVDFSLTVFQKQLGFRGNGRRYYWLTVRSHDSPRCVTPSLCHVFYF